MTSLDFDWYLAQLGEPSRWDTRDQGARDAFWPCPLGDGDNPTATSLHVSELPDGGVKVKDFAHDHKRSDIESAVGEIVRMAMPKPSNQKRAASPQPPASAKRDPRAWLAAKCSVDPKFLDDLPLSFESGMIVYRFGDLDVVKVRPAGGSSRDSRWRPEGEHTPPIWPLLDTMPSDILLTEGETDAIAVRGLGYDAFAVTKGSSKELTRAEFEELKRRGVQKVFVGYDADTAGREGESKIIAGALETGLDVASVIPPGYDALSGRGKDWCDWRASGATELPSSMDNDPMIGPAQLGALVADRPDPVIRGWLNRGGVLLVVGGPKDGKTSMVAGMAGAAERESSQFAGIKASKAGSVWLTEEGYDTFEEKVQRYGLKDYRALFRHVAAQHEMTFEASVSRAASRAAAENRILVVDTIAAWAGLDSEADAGAVNAALSVIRFAVVPRRIPAVVVHQTNRAGSYRGSTEFLAQADAMALLRREGAEEWSTDARAVEIVSRYEGAADPVVLVRAGAAYTAVGQPRPSFGKGNDARAARHRDMRTLLSESGWTTSRLRNHFGVSQRTLDADLKDIGAIGTRTGAGTAADEKEWTLNVKHAASRGVARTVTQSDTQSVTHK
jgi:hypothetical protein